MHLQFRHKGRRVKRIEWNKDMYYDLIAFCEEYIFAYDQNGILVKIDRNDNDLGWELVQ